MRCSVMQTTCVPASLNATRFTAVGNSQVNRHLPVATSQSRRVLSAAPDTMYFDWARSHSQGPPHVQTEIRRTIDINRPDGAIVPFVCAQPLSVMRVPHIDDIILRACEQQVSVCVEFNLRKRSLVSYSKRLGD